MLHYSDFTSASSTQKSQTTEQTLATSPDISNHNLSSSTSLSLENPFKRRKLDSVKIEDGTMIKNIITPELVCALDRCKVSDWNAVYLIAAVTSSIGQDVSKITLNRESIRTTRIKFRRDLNENIRNSFDTNAKLTVHWDSAMMQNIAPGTYLEKVDRLAITVSGSSVQTLFQS